MLTFAGVDHVSFTELTTGLGHTPNRDMELGFHLTFRDPDNIALEL